MHSEVSGVAHKVFQNDLEAIASTRKLMSFLPQNCNDKRDHKPWTDEDRANQTSTELLNNIVPHDPKATPTVTPKSPQRHPMFKVAPN